MKLLISHFLSVLEYQTWFLINAKIQHLYPMIRYANNIILNFMTFGENMRNWIKYRKIKGVYLQNYLYFSFQLP